MKFFYNVKKRRNFIVFVASLISVLIIMVIAILSRNGFHSTYPQKQATNPVPTTLKVDDAKQKENKKSETVSIPKQPPATGAFNYGEALQKAVFFYDCQRSGKLENSRPNWRGDSGMNDGKDAGLDLTGGLYDAGDHVKFNLPMAYTASMLGWAVYEYKDAFTKSGQLNYILDNIKWTTDYLIKCHPQPDVYYYQVGNGNADHAWWGPAEAMAMDRPSYKVDKSSPGSAVVAQASAALAVASIIFKDIDNAYSKECLKHSKELFQFAQSTKSDSGYTAANDFYKSWSGFYDELSWAGAWLHIATKDTAYLEKAQEYSSKWGTEPQSTTIAYKWSHCWDDVHYGAALLIARLTKNSGIYKESLEMHLDWWTKGYNGESIQYTPKGLAWLAQWGSLRYATTTAFLASVYSDWSGCDDKKAEVYKEFAKSQAEYALGSTGRSFVVGFGENPPLHPHHRTAHGSWANSQAIPQNHRHTLYGALVGGPDVTDAYKDDINDYVCNEVACDYNAGFVGLLAKMYSLYGGSPSPDFNGIEKITEDEIFIEAGINASGTNFVEIKAILYNQSGWPARLGNNLSFRYFMDLSEIIAQNKSPEDIKTSASYNQGGKVSSLKHYKGNIYYVNVDFQGTNIYPGGQSEHKKEIQLRISAPEGVTFDPANDFSSNGLSSGSVKKTKYIPIYDKGVKVWGIEPDQKVEKNESKGNSTNNGSEDSKNTNRSDSEVTTPGNSTSSRNSPKPLSTSTVKNTSSPQIKNNDGKNTKSTSQGNGSILIEYSNGNTTPNSNSINPRFRLSNKGSSVDLSKIKICYYYTINGEKKQTFWCDWSSASNSNVTGNFKKLSNKSSADYCLEIGFKNGSGFLNKNESIEIQGRFSKDDWSNYNQSDDFSFSSSTSYIKWDKIALYIDGKLLFGKVP